MKRLVILVLICLLSGVSKVRYEQKDDALFAAVLGSVRFSNQ